MDEPKVDVGEDPDVDIREDAALEEITDTKVMVVLEVWDILEVPCPAERDVSEEIWDKRLLVGLED